MKVTSANIGGEVVRATDTCIVTDNKTLNSLVLSQTQLQPGAETRGHSHDGQEEIYFFESGVGKIQVGEKELKVHSGDIVLIPAGAFHKVWNTGSFVMVFNCVFQGARE